MPSDIFLEKPQIELLGRMVEATRNVHLTGRVSFQFAELFDSRAVLDHPGFTQEIVAFGDIVALEREGLLALRYERNQVGKVDVTPKGIQLYERWRMESGASASQLEKQVISYLDTDSFRGKYGSANEKWQAAADLLWKADSNIQLSVVGHLCREAIQEFAYALPSISDAVQGSPKSQTVMRIRTSLNAIGSATERAMLDALLTYWGTVSDLVQRQEHAGERESEELTWEDARRAVFHSALVMFEISVALDRSVRRRQEST